MARFRAPARLRQVGRDDRLTVVEHLEELRWRLVSSAGALVLAFIVLYVFNEQLIDLLIAPLPDDKAQLITLSPTEPFVTTLKIVFFSAIIVALPIWLYQLYAYVIPAVAEQPRRRMLAIVGGVSSLFVAGVAFGFFVVLPVALNFLLGFGDETFNSQVRAADYFGFATTLMLASGMLFEVPVAMLALAKIGVVTAKQFRAQWRIAIVVIAVLAAILPGGDPFSMMLLMIPQIALYALGIWLASAFGGPSLWARRAFSESDEADTPGAA